MESHVDYPTYTQVSFFPPFFVFFPFLGIFIPLFDFFTCLFIYLYYFSQHFQFLALWTDRR